MTITNTIAAKLVGVSVAVAMLLTLSGSALAESGQTQTDEEQLMNLAAIIMQLVANQGSMATPGYSATASVCPYQWTRSLATGDSGADVMKLQQFLNSDPATRVAATGIGSAGQETQYYGGLTAQAVSKFQTKHSNRVLVPVGLINPTGTFGPSTRQEANSQCVAPSMVMVPVNPASPVTPGPSDDDTQRPQVANLAGEAELDTYEIDDLSDDEVTEGSSDAELAEIMIKVEDGDALIHRIILSFAAASSVSENDPEDVFEAVSLWVDGEMVAEMDTNRSSSWKGSDDDTLRFSGLDLSLQSDEEMTITVAATLQDGIDPDRGSVNGDKWTIMLGDLRLEDGTGYVSEESALGSEDAQFTIIAEGSDDELKLGYSDLDPNAKTLKLDEDNSTKNQNIFAFELDAEDSDNDIEISKVAIDFMSSTTISSSTIRTSVLEDQPEFDRDGELTLAELLEAPVSDLFDADDVKLMIDGEVVKSESEKWDTTGNRLILKFDADDFVVPAGQTVEVELEVEFKDFEQKDFYKTTIFASVSNARIMAEGPSDEVTVDGSMTVTGSTHTLRTSGLVFNTDYGSGNSAIKYDFTLNEDEDKGTFTFTFEVEAFEEDVYIKDMVTSADNDSSTVIGEGVTVAVKNSEGYYISGTNSIISNIVSSSADERNSGQYLIKSGKSETFEVSVKVNPDDDGSYRVVLLGIGYNLTDDDAAVHQVQVAAPSKIFRTGRHTIDGN